MESKRVMVNQVRDFPLPIEDVQSERESVLDIVDQRDVFGELAVVLIDIYYWQAPDHVQGICLLSFK